MRAVTFAEFKDRFQHRVRVRTRVLDCRRRVPVFSSDSTSGSLGRVYVINLDRKPARWRRLRRELDRFRGRNGTRLTTLARRVSAIDARYMTTPPDAAILQPVYTLADQLTVDPNPLLRINERSRAHKIDMTTQEVAVALSHIETWRRIAAGTDEAALILEDDVVMTRGFANRFQDTWRSLLKSTGELDFDLLFLAYNNVDASMQETGRYPVRRSKPGIWEAAAYVVTRAAAQELLDRLPAFGPIDLWLNLQFETMKAFTSGRPIIEQRLDEPSTNSYSVLPVLSQVGVVNEEKASLPPSQRLLGPVIGIGSPGTGLTALAAALSMVGYTCLSDVDRMPGEEFESLRRGDRRRLFNAYVNIGAVDLEAAETIARTHPRARFILTTTTSAASRLPRNRVLNLGPDLVDKWEALTEFLGIEYPAFKYPDVPELGLRETVLDELPRNKLPPSQDLRFDASPWIVSRPALGNRGLKVHPEARSVGRSTPIKWSSGEALDLDAWKLRDDTFPSNLALFSPTNVAIERDQIDLVIRREDAVVRDFTAAAVASRDCHRYGSFSAELKPAKGSGLITGLFLHRNGPRQEIDIEFLGRDTSTMLVNVFYNPGPEGTKLEYGYRGTPTEVALGFDAAGDFHLYEIEWQPEYIRWKVDGAVVYERQLWAPTPIPDSALEFNLNIWHSRSIELAGKLDLGQLPASASVRSIAITPGVH